MNNLVEHLNEGILKGKVKHMLLGPDCLQGAQRDLPPYIMNILVLTKFSSPKCYAHAYTTRIYDFFSVCHTESQQPRTSAVGYI
jgi:hypothetical protein